MTKLPRQFGAMGVLVVVLAAFLLPGINLEPTALRAARAAQQLLMAFAFLALLATAHRGLSIVLGHRPVADSAVARQRPVIDLICVRLC